MIYDAGRALQRVTIGEYVHHLIDAHHLPDLHSVYHRHDNQIPGTAATAKPKAAKECVKATIFSDEDV